MKISVFSAIVFLLTTLMCKGDVLRLADASGGACGRLFIPLAVELAGSGDLNVSFSRELPSAALKALAEDKFDAVIVDRRFAGNLKRFPIAAEALTLYVSDVNPTGDLPAKTVRDILLARHPDWRKINGLNTDIQRIAMKELAPSGNLIRRVFGNIDLPEEIFRVDSATSGLAFINSASIFFTGYIAILPPGIKQLKINGIMPTTATVANGKYPFSMQYVIVWRKMSPELQKLLNHLKSGKFRKIIADSGFIALLPPAITEDKK
ncbi:MAG: hypothetical protein IKC82_05405 [Lentisphaeria bacterium]|nr:hypothetical protein [Lentisphaeria bacterium]